MGSSGFCSNQLFFKRKQKRPELKENVVLGPTSPLQRAPPIYCLLCYPSNNGSAPHPCGRSRLIALSPKHGGIHNLSFFPLNIHIKVALSTVKLSVSPLMRLKCKTSLKHLPENRKGRGGAPRRVPSLPVISQY